MKHTEDAEEALQLMFYWLPVWTREDLERIAMRKYEQFHSVQSSTGMDLTDLNLIMGEKDPGATGIRTLLDMEARSILGISALDYNKL